MLLGFGLALAEPEEEDERRDDDKAPAYANKTADRPGEDAQYDK